MGRAKGTDAAVSTDGFHAVLGSRRGASRLDLSARHPDAPTRAHAQKLGLQAASGDTRPALRELQLAGATPAIREHAPLLADLFARSVRGISHATKLWQPEREALYAQLGLPDGLKTVAEPSPRALDQAVGAELDRQLADGDIDSGALAQTAADLHRESFCRGLAHELQGTSAFTVLHLLGGETDGQLTLANLPGVPSEPGPLQRARWAAQLLTEMDWRGMFSDALDADKPAVFLHRRLSSALYERAHERYENDTGHSAA